MSVSTEQYRNSIGTHLNKLNDNNWGKNVQQKDINQHCLANPDEIRCFGSYVNRVVNSSESNGPTKQNTASLWNTIVQFMLFLSQVKLADSPAPVSGTGSVNFYAPGFDSGSVTNNTPHPVSGNGLMDALDGIGWLITEYDPLRFPEAGAMPIPQTETKAIQASGIVWDAKSETYIITDKQVKKELISSLGKFLVTEHQLTAEESEVLESRLQKIADKHPIVIACLNGKDTAETRNPRALAAENNPQTAKHIEEHCAFPQGLILDDILDGKGNKQGKLLLLNADRHENPFRRIFDSKKGRPSPEERGVADGLNIISNIITLGIMSSIGSLIADAERQKYYKQKGDKICEERYRRLTKAEFLTSLGADGLSFRTRGRAGKGNPFRKVKPKEFGGAVSKPEEAAFYIRNPETGIRTGILLELEGGKKELYYGGKTIYIKPTGKPDEYLTYLPYGVNQNFGARKVIRMKDGSFRFADDFDTTGLNVVSREGKHQIYLHGEYRELNKNRYGKHFVVVREESGAILEFPVYMEAISGEWHLAVHNGYPVFSKSQKKIIRKIRVDKKLQLDAYYTIPNIKPEKYGSGMIITVEKGKIKGDFIEMNGSIVPVRIKQHKGGGVSYEAFDRKNPEKKGYPLAFDGERWIFKPFVSDAIKEKLKKVKLTSDITADKLSAPDSMGLRYSETGESYLKINGLYFKIYNLNGNRYAIGVAGKNPRIVLRFHDNKYDIETVAERLKNIQQVGLGGKRRNAEQILADLDGFSPEKARKILSQYDFPSHGICSAEGFAIDTEQLGKFPQWANKYLKGHFDTKSIKIVHPDLPEVNAEYKLDTLLGHGAFGEVYVDADNPEFVIKIFTPEESGSSFGSDTVSSHSSIQDNLLEQARKEAEAFNLYYGEGSARVWKDDKGRAVMRMYKVPGVTLDSLPENSLPANAIELFVNEIEKLGRLGIMNKDMHPGNTLWDGNTFRFIDLTNMKNEYFSADSFTRLEYNEIGEQMWKTMIEAIEDRIIRN